MSSMGLPEEIWASESSQRGSQRRAGRAPSEYSKDFWFQKDVKIWILYKVLVDQETRWEGTIDLNNGEQTKIFPLCCNTKIVQV